MDPEHRARAEARLAEAATSHGLADPRPPYRERLRHVRQTSTDTFNRAIEHYERNVLPALATGEPLHVWLEYGRYLGSLSGDGRVVCVDGEGRAAAVTAESSSPDAALVLFIPEDTSADVLVLCQPADPSDAQLATMTLLVDRKLSMG